MSEPVKKIEKAPESYSPKKMPEILNMMGQRSVLMSDSAADPFTGGEPPRLSGIRPLLDGMKGNNYGLPDCIKFILERVDGGEKPDFWDIAAVTGDSVAQVYNRNQTTSCEYCVSGYLGESEHIAYVFDALGYGHEYVSAERFNADTAYYLRKTALYINNDIPVLVKTNLNDVPAWKSDVGTFCLIVGLENGGQVLKLLVGGTSPIVYEVTGNNKLDFIFIGEKQREVSLSELYLKAIEKMPYWLTLPERDGMFFGAAAYRAWADDIENRRFAQEGIALWENYGVYVCNLATSGGESTFIFEKLAKMEPACSELEALGKKIRALLPTQTPTGGRSLLWIKLDELRAGMNMDEVYVTMRDREKCQRVAAVLRDYANRLDAALELLSAGIVDMFCDKEDKSV